MSLTKSGSIKTWYHLVPLVAFLMAGMLEAFTGKFPILLSFIFLVSGVILFGRTEVLVKYFKENWLLTIFLAYTFLSCFWSPFPIVSLKRWIQFLGIVLVGLAAISRPHSFKTIHTILMWYTGATLLLSITLIFIVASGEFIAVDGAWTGFASSKNGFGALCTLAIVVWLPVLGNKESKLKSRFALLALMLGFLGLWGSQSATALISIFTVLFIYSLIKIKINPAAKMLFLPVPILIFCFYIMNFTPYTPMDYLFQSVGRDNTLTGRTELWSMMIGVISEHPFFGIGYNGFWMDDGLSTAIVDSLLWAPRQAHNGYLDIINELGFVGLGLFLLVIGQSLFRAFRFIDWNNLTTVVFLFIICVAIVGNFAESSFCRIKKLEWWAFLLSFVCITPFNRNNTGQVLNE